jgi:hypothetical protein
VTAANLAKQHDLAGHEKSGAWRRFSIVRMLSLQVRLSHSISAYAEWLWIDSKFSASSV